MSDACGRLSLPLCVLPAAPRPACGMVSGAAAATELAE